MIGQHSTDYLSKESICSGDIVWSEVPSLRRGEIKKGLKTLLSLRDKLNSKRDEFLE